MYSTTAPSNKELHEIKEQQAVTRSQRLRAAYRFIPESAFKMRKEFFANKVGGKTNAWAKLLETD
jgi:hypothetical protein